ncbi:hypothetical protein PUN28_016093 [Cardiocondyla obscurior]|uniref:Secreted protein n=1 Tax=Cardiocondyla obscurior TaxID=286306 RepID=A0AAW2EUP0_9HYME
MRELGNLELRRFSSVILRVLAAAAATCWHPSHTGRVRGPTSPGTAYVKIGPTWASATFLVRHHLKKKKRKKEKRKRKKRER